MYLRKYKPVFMISVSILFLILVVAVVSAFWPKYEEQFFELGLLGRNRNAEEYFPNDNSTLQIGSLVFWHIYIHNHMESVQNVSIRVKLLNSTMQAPDDRKHEPSALPYLMEFPLSLSISETITIPFYWNISEAIITEKFISIKSLTVNNQTAEVNVPAFSSNRFRMVFELWVYDQSSGKYQYGWNIGKDSYSVSVYIWFSLNSLTV